MTSTPTHPPTRHATRRPPAAAPVPGPSPGPQDGDALLEGPEPPPHELIEGPDRDELIRRRAYDLYEREGCVDGHALDDWLNAEAEVDRLVVEGAAPLESAAERE